MVKQQEVIIEAIYNLGKLVNPGLDMGEVRRILRVNVPKEVLDELSKTNTKADLSNREEVDDLRNREFIFTGKRLADTESLQENPEVNLTRLDTTVKIRECHLDDTYKFSEDGRVYDEFLQGYIKPESRNNHTTVQLMINRTVINVEEDFIRYYATTEDTKHANKLLDDALLTVRSITDKEESKQKRELKQQLLHKERESQSERYNYHTKTEGMHLAHTPYILTEEGRVFDTELGSLRAVNNRGYTTNLNKGFKIPVNISINNIKNMFGNQDFTILIERAGYTKAQCEDMWRDYQNRLQAKNATPIHKSRALTNGVDVDEEAQKAGFIKTEDGYYIHKSQVQINT